MKTLTSNNKIKAIGRYNTIRKYAKKHGLKAVSLKSLAGQRGVYNADIVAKKFNCNVIDETPHTIWYKGWCAI
jgi:hypothetical protein